MFQHHVLHRRMMWYVLAVVVAPIALLVQPHRAAAASSVTSNDAAAKHCASAVTPAQGRDREVAILQLAMQKGAVPTAAGTALLNGAAIGGDAPAQVSGATGDVILAETATAPASGTPRMTKRFQALRAPARVAGSDYVFLDCGPGAEGNVNFETGPGAHHVNWYDEPLVGGTGEWTTGPTGYCPSGQTCLVWAYHYPPNGAWQTFDAEIFAVNGPYDWSGYCS